MSKSESNDPARRAFELRKRVDKIASAVVEESSSDPIVLQLVTRCRDLTTRLDATNLADVDVAALHLRVVGNLEHLLTVARAGDRAHLRRLATNYLAALPGEPTIDELVELRQDASFDLPDDPTIDDASLPGDPSLGGESTIDER